MAAGKKSGMFNHKFSTRFVANHDISLQKLIRDAVHETNTEVHRELNMIVGKRVIESNEESSQKRQKQLDGE